MIANTRNRVALALIIVGVGCCLLATNAHAKSRSTVDRFVSQFVDQCWPQVVAPVEGKHRLMVHTRFRQSTKLGPQETLSETILERLEGELRKRMSAPRIEFLSNVTLSNTADLIEATRNTNSTRLLVVELFLERNHLHLSGKRYDVNVTLWSRIRNPPGGVRGHYFHSTRIDAELRALMDKPPIRKSQPSFREEVIPISGLKTVLGGGMGDLDGDGFQELVFLHANELTVHRWTPDQAPEQIATYNFSTVTRRNRRTRDPFGSIVIADIDGDGADELAFWTSDLKNGHIVSMQHDKLLPRLHAQPRFSCGHGSEQEKHAQLCGPPLMAEPRKNQPDRMQILQGDVPWGRNHLTKRISIWNDQGGGLYRPYPGMHWNLFGGLHRFSSGPPAVLRTTIDHDGTLIVRTSNHAWTLPKDAGLAGTLTDFDDDGEAELIRTRKSGPQGPDAIYIHRLPQQREEPLEIWRNETMTTPIEFLASGDMDNDGFNDVLIVRGGLPYRLTENHRSH